MEYVWSTYGIPMEYVWNNTVATPGYHRARPPCPRYSNAGGNYGVSGAALWNDVEAALGGAVGSFSPALLTCFRWHCNLLP